MSQVLANLSINFVYSATAVYGLAMLAHAAEWAVARERRTAPPTAAPVRKGTSAEVLVGSGGPEGLLQRGGASGSDADDASAEGTDEAEWSAGEERIDRFGRIGVGLTVLATLLIGAGVITRGVAADRVPWSNLYEFTITAVFIVSVAYLALFKRYRLGWLGLPVTGLLLVSVMCAVILLYEPVSGLIPALKSYWLIIHVSAATSATGVLTVALLATVLQLFRARWERRAVAAAASTSAGEAAPAPRGYLGRLPSAEAIDRLAYRLHAFAFPIWTFAMICGAIWARDAWGRYWGWDPKEVWMFITWVVYAAYLHARSTAGWRNKTPWIAIVGYACLLFNLIGVNFLLSGLHSYA